MMHSWDRTTRVRWSERSASTGLAACLLLFLLVPSVCPQTLESLARPYRSKPTPQRRSALLRFAAAHPKDTAGALALLVVGVAELEGKNYAEATRRLRVARDRLPALSDYTSFYLAEAHYASEKSSEALRDLDRVIRSSPVSPLVGRAVLRAAAAHLENGAAPEAVGLLREHLSRLPQPKGTLTLASALLAAKDLAAAAASYQRVYYDFPLSGEADQAKLALEGLRGVLGESYTPAGPQAMLGRASTLMKAGQHGAAVRELEAMAGQLSGTDRDLARARLGGARYLAGENLTAYRYLQSLRVSSAAADAERLYYLVGTARRLDRRAEMLGALEELSRRYPASPSRLDALISVGNEFLLANDVESYVPVFQTCVDAFPRDPQAPYCHWKVAWSAYLRRRPEAADLLRQHVQKFPASEKASAALYFLGRLAETGGDIAAAKSYYQEIATEYPNFYYAVLARERLEQTAFSRAVASKPVQAFLSSIEFPVRSHEKDFQTNAASQRRIERARLLASAGLEEWAETELWFGAKNDGQPPVLALELARTAQRRDAHAQGIRYIKALAGGYLSMPLESAPASFWRLAFPLPYRREMEKYGRRRSLDVHFLAALIRQESEFDPRAVSRAKAYGLTQVLPSTGRQLSRKLGIRPFRTSLLYRPDINLNMGTYYFRSILDSFDGNTEAALASYNAGKSRVVNWLTWAEFREPAEFVETIPFTETRNYVQTVLRNADIYRRLYSSPENAGESARPRPKRRTG